EQERLSREAAEKQKEQERLSREAAEKQKEQERLSRIAEDKRKEQERRAEKTARQSLEKKRRAREIEQEQIEQARLAEAARQQKLRQSAEIKSIRQMITAAETKLANHAYGAAAQVYEKALAVIAASEFQSGKQHQKLNRTVASALQSDAIVYGAKGYVFYKNKWFAPEDYQKQLLAEGFVKYKGDFVLYKKLGPVIGNLAKKEARAFLTKKYSGKQVHKKQIDLHTLSLTQNTLLQSRYEVLFNWEIWTFTDIAKGRCSVEVRYDAEKDEWKTMQARTP
ncbi:MAG: hypothetical protein GY697_27470, partial [Desulfobacterales bacterium]|nr:hypothetical protein [Desulfobacterales bacterium]